jgi:hypothetical protein
MKLAEKYSLLVASARQLVLHLYGVCEKQSYNRVLVLKSANMYFPILTFHEYGDQQDCNHEQKQHHG